MLTRTVSTLLLWAITIAAVIYGKAYGWAAIVGLLSAGAIFETCSILRKMGCAPMSKSLQISNILIFGGICAMSHYAQVYIWSGAIITAILLAAYSLSILKNPFNSFFCDSLMPSVLVLMAIPFNLQWLVAIGFVPMENEYAGIIMAIAILASAKCSDVGAYLAGKAFGRHKLAPNISPKKTVEGAIGGLALATAIGTTILCGFSNNMLKTEISPACALAFGLLIGTIAVCSDLAESVLKRRAGVKDSGALIPGIGGILDLADSILLSAPVGIFLLYAMFL